MLSLAIKRIKKLAWRLINSAIPKNRTTIALCSFPDFDDTARAFCNYSKSTGRKVVLLTGSRNIETPAWAKIDSIKIHPKQSILGIWIINRSKLIFFTHGISEYFTPSKNQICVNLWHGMPIKNIALLDKKPKSELPKFDYAIADDQRFRTVISKAFDVPESNVLITKHPRIDILLNPKPNRFSKETAHFRKVVFWLPTYRSSRIGDIRQDGNPSSEISSLGSELEILDNLLIRHDSVCIVKPHPMAPVVVNNPKKYKNIKFINESILSKFDTTLYEVLADTDILITDLSSIYFDFKVLDRPILLFVSDLDEYARTRGFTLPLQELVDEPIHKQFDSLIQALETQLASDKNCSHSTLPRQFKSLHHYTSKIIDYPYTMH